MSAIRVESDSLGKVEVPADKLWGAQTQRSLEHFSIGHDLIPREMIAADATLKRCAAAANFAGGRLSALSPVIGYDKASKIAHYAMENDLTLKSAALQLGFVTEHEFDGLVDPAKMVHPYVAHVS
jgi:fumarate hydratase class II